MTIVRSTVAAEFGFDCPRCDMPVVERFYGPCTACREEMRRVVRPPEPDPRFADGNVPAPKLKELVEDDDM